MPSAAEAIATRCCIAGGGPAGIMLALLLARADVDVVVLEKHADFLRDFRGDTIHPSTLEVLDELGLLDAFLRLPHQKVSRLNVQIGTETVALGHFAALPTKCKFIAFIPQWDFLTFLAEQGQRFPAFHLRMSTEVTGLIEDGGQVRGVCASTAGGPLEVRAELVVGADGRDSVVRERAGLHVEDLGAPMDVLWFRLSHRPGDPEGITGRIDAGRVFVALDRTEHWQCGFVFAKGGIDEIHRRGLPAFRAEVARLAPFTADRVDELRDWDQVELLTVRVDRLRQWYRPGLLCIGDAAHAMSPIGGVGINLAIQDAVAAANLLAAPLRSGRIGPEHLRQVERRRTFPTRIIQRLQIVIQNRVISRVLASRGTLRPPLLLRVLAKTPLLRTIPAWLVGIGPRPEHVRTPPATR